MKLLLTALVAGAALAGAALAATPERVVASKATTGGFALAKVSTTVRQPARLRVRVTATPRQAVLASYTVSCRKGRTTARRTRQYLPASSPTVRWVALPLKRPDRCTLTGQGQLSHGEGRIVVELLARRR